MGRLLEIRRPRENGLGAVTRRSGKRHFWDTQLRRGENYDEKWEYIRANPVRAGLVPRVEDWPHQGELNELRW
jgi:hypothetical protein